MSAKVTCKECGQMPPAWEDEYWVKHDDWTCSCGFLSAIDTKPEKKAEPVTEECDGDTK